MHTGFVWGCYGDRCSRARLECTSYCPNTFDLIVLVESPRQALVTGTIFRPNSPGLSCSIGIYFSFWVTSSYVTTLNFVVHTVLNRQLLIGRAAQPDNVYSRAPIRKSFTYLPRIGVCGSASCSRSRCGFWSGSRPRRKSQSGTGRTAPKNCDRPTGAAPPATTSTTWSARYDPASGVKAIVGRWRA